MRRIIPSELFLNGTLFTQMAIMGNVNYKKDDNEDGKMIAPHIDDGDIYTVYLTLGSLTEGGGSMFFGIDKNLNYTSVDFQNCNIFMGQMDSIKHGAYAWSGKRITLTFYCSRAMLQFFRRKGSAEIYAEYKKLNFIRKQFVAIEYSSKTNSVSHLVCDNNAELKKHADSFEDLKLYATEPKEKTAKPRKKRKTVKTNPVAGYYEKKEHKYTSRQYLWSCVHDTIMNTSLCLNIQLDRRKVYSVNPPSFEYVDVETVFNSDYIKENMEFIRLNLNNTKGGLNFNLLQLMNKGVYFVCSKISKPCGKFWYHCFVYDSRYKDKETSCYGRLIDNDPTTRQKIIEHRDRLNKPSANKCLRDVYGNRCDVTFIYEVRKIQKINND